MSVVRCSHAAVKDEDCRKSSVFHTYITYEGKNYKLIIDGGSSANIIAKTALEKMSLKVEPHPHPYNVDWVDKNAQSITSVVKSLSTCLATVIVFGVMS